MFNLEGTRWCQRGPRETAGFVGRGGAVERANFGPWAEARDAELVPTRGFSTAGRAPALQAGGHRFESGNLHHAGQ